MEGCVCGGELEITALNEYLWSLVCVKDGGIERQNSFLLVNWLSACQQFVT
jgi:hypothetical protein